MATPAFAAPGAPAHRSDRQRRMRESLTRRLIVVVGAGRAGAQWWLPAALAGVVVALAVGILGMHVLTSTHVAHGAATTLAEPAPDAGHAGAVAAQHRAVPADQPMGTTTVVPSATPAPGTSVRTAPNCDTPCDAGAEALCLAVLGALLVLVLGRSGRLLGTAGRPDAVRTILASLSARAGPAPSQTVLCVSRT